MLLLLLLLPEIPKRMRDSAVPVPAQQQPGGHTVWRPVVVSCGGLLVYTSHSK